MCNFFIVSADCQPHDKNSLFLIVRFDSVLLIVFNGESRFPLKFWRKCRIVNICFSFFIDYALYYFMKKRKKIDNIVFQLKKCYRKDAWAISFYHNFVKFWPYKTSRSTFAILSSNSVNEIKSSRSHLEVFHKIAVS